MNLAARMVEVLRAEPPRHAEETAGRLCEHDAVITVLDAAGSIVDKLSRDELLGEAAAWQSWLRDHGVATGTRVALCPPRTRALPSLHLATLACGAVVVPVNPSLSSRERAELLAAAQVSLLVEEKLAMPRPNRGMVPEPAPRADGDPALLIFTSGTTGRPKSVPLTHGNLAADLDALATVWQRSSADRLLHLLPAHHLHGLSLALYGSLLAGSEIVLAPSFDARRALDAISAERITVMMGVPTMYARMLAAAVPGDDISGLRLALCGSAPLGARAWEAFRRRFGVPLIERYGLTEVGIVTSNPLDHPVAGSVGLPIPGATIVILTDEGYVAPTPGIASKRGEVCIAGPTVMPGYGNDDEANARAFVDGYFRSGDLGHFDENGYLWIDGRIKDLIIVGGSNVVPAEVERAVEGIPEVAECAAVGLADADLGEIVALFVVPGAASLSPADVEAAVVAAAQAGLARYKQPRRVFVVAELPRNAMGKVDRSRLRAPDSG